jgi:hypothetical protein
MIMSLNIELVEILREMHGNAAQVSQMLSEIKKFHCEEPQIKMCTMKYLREAFGLSLADVTPVGGWCGLGGELSDEEINGLIQISR